MKIETAKCKPKLVYITTVPITLDITLKGQLRFMSQSFEVVGVTSYDAERFETIQKREGIRLHAVEMVRPISILRDVGSLIGLIGFLGKEKPDIVFTRNPKAGLLGMAAAWFVRVPIRIHSVVGMPFLSRSGWKRCLLMFFEKLTLLFSTFAYPISLRLSEIMIRERLCVSGKLKVIGGGSVNGIDADYFSPGHYRSMPTIKTDLKNNYGLSADDFVFCFVGRLNKDKGINELLEAFLNLITECGDNFCRLKLILVGVLEKKHNLNEKVIRNIMQHKNIRFLGRFDDIRPFLFMSDALVLPSYREGFPAVLMEAGAMGLPCIASDINGSNEIIIHGENGLIVPPRNSIALKEAMRQMVCDAALRSKMASKSRKMILGRYPQETIWRGLLEDFLNFLDNNKRVGEVTHGSASSKS